MSYTREEFALEIINKLSKGHYGVKLLKDGTVLLDVGGYMQSNGEIGKYADPNFDESKFIDYLIE